MGTLENTKKYKILNSTQEIVPVLTVRDLLIFAVIGLGGQCIDHRRNCIRFWIA